MNAARNSKFPHPRSLITCLHYALNFNKFWTVTLLWTAKIKRWFIAYSLFLIALILMSFQPTTQLFVILIR